MGVRLTLVKLGYMSEPGKPLGQSLFPYKELAQLSPFSLAETVRTDPAWLKQSWKPVVQPS